MKIVNRIHCQKYWSQYYHWLEWNEKLEAIIVVDWNEIIADTSWQEPNDTTANLNKAILALLDNQARPR